ncbi:hypothetical protein BYT27DRAFT_7224704 [Phlegmacium glaucopus]|nr:hypothetical protein BYT27DRAFT_7224704 [Phlegmacium glaucopus]
MSPGLHDSLPASTELVAVSSTTLHRSVYIPAFVLGYTALAIFAWAVTCILSYRPITTDHYGIWFSLNYIHPLFVKNEQWFRMARFIQSIVTVLTIPLTSAVCSKAAVVFIQRQSGLSLRQAMVLADKGWTEPKLYAKLLFASGGLKRYGSSFLFLAILLNILGGIISPLQSLFLTSRTIKTPTRPGMVVQLTDILDLFKTSSYDLDLIPVLVRSAITSTSKTDLQSGLWTSSPIICNTPTSKNDNTDPTSESCALGGITLANMSQLPEPFLAQLPLGYNTGLIRQFLPRINSSATREVITEADFPANCDTLPGSFYVNYANAREFGNWSLIACMPANQINSPWKPVRTRQDFSEELYLNLSVSGFGAAPWDPPETRGGLFKIIVNTTAGFFELPNYMNRQLPGPLLDDDPSNYCGIDCVSQGYYLDPIK